MKRIIYAVLAIAAVAGLIAITNNNEKESAVLSEQKPDAAAQQSAEEKKKTEEAAKLAAETFSYTSQPGDSYSLMARKSIQNFLAENKMTLTNAQILFAETNLTQLAKSPYLEVGQKVRVAKSTLKEWTEKAKNLTKEQEARWNVYAQYANFDTSRVGLNK